MKRIENGDVEEETDTPAKNHSSLQKEIVVRRIQTFLFVSLFISFFRKEIIHG